MIIFLTIIITLFLILNLAIFLLHKKFDPKSVVHDIVMMFIIFFNIGLATLIMWSVACLLGISHNSQKYVDKFNGYFYNIMYDDVIYDIDYKNNILVLKFKNYINTYEVEIKNENINKVVTNPIQMIFYMVDGSKNSYEITNQIQRKWNLDLKFKFKKRNKMVLP